MKLPKPSDGEGSDIPLHYAGMNLMSGKGWSPRRWGLPPPACWPFWISLSLIAKLALVTFWAGSAFWESPYRLGGDSPSYIEPIENLLGGRGYSPDHRMPGYGAVYLLLRSWLPQDHAFAALVGTQFALGATANYLLALILLSLRGSFGSFIFGMIVTSLNTMSIPIETRLYTEGFTFFALSAGLLLYTQSTRRQGHHSLIVGAGTLWTWAFFLKPAYALVLPLIAMVEMGSWRRAGSARVRARFARFALLLCPAVVVDGAWILRNYIVHQEIVPLTRTVWYPRDVDTFYDALIGYLQAWGGRVEHWEEGSEVRFFLNADTAPDLGNIDGDSVTLPDKAKPKESTWEELAALRQEIALVYDVSRPIESRRAADIRLKSTFGQLEEAIKNERPFGYYIGSRLSYLQFFVVHSGSGYLFKGPFTRLSWPQLVIKLLYSSFYWWALLFGIAGAVRLLMIRNWDRVSFSVALLVFYPIVVFPFLMQLSQPRYFLPTFGVYLVAAGFVSCELASRHLRFTRADSHSRLIDR